MSLNDIFRRFFGIGKQRQENEFPYVDDQFPGPNMDDQLNAFQSQADEMFHHFERHFQEIFKSFGFMDFNVPSVPYGPEVPALPSPEEESLRDSLLKKPERESSSSSPWFNDFYGERSADESLKHKQDYDLDSEVSRRGLGAVLRKSDLPEETSPRVHSSFRSSSSITVRGPDGKVEHREKTKDGLGNEVMTITRQYGDQIHSVKTKRNRDGTQEQEENFVNMSEDRLKEFEREFHREGGDSNHNYLTPPNSLNPFAPGIFQRLFKDFMPKDN